MIPRCRQTKLFLRRALSVKKRVEGLPICRQSIGYGLGAGLGWALAILLLAGLRQKMRYSHVPEPFKGVAIAMVVTGVLAMTFMGFAGMVSIQ